MYICMYMQTYVRLFTCGYAIGELLILGNSTATRLVQRAGKSIIRQLKILSLLKKERERDSLNNNKTIYNRSYTVTITIRLLTHYFNTAMLHEICIYFLKINKNLYNNMAKFDKEEFK